MRGEAIPIFPTDIGLPVRERDTHKSDYGKILILGGSVGYTGAVSMCARAAIRSGAGLVSVGVPEDIYPIIAAKLDEPMPFPMEQPLQFREITEKLAASDACIIGPGLGRSDDALDFAREVLKQIRIPTVVDADALYAPRMMCGCLKAKSLLPMQGNLLGWVEY